MLVYRTEQHHIKPNHQFYKIIDNLCFKSKNLYNKALYDQRHCLFSNQQFMSYPTLYDYIKTEDSFKDLPSALGQQILRQVTTNCISFTKATKEYYKNPTKFLGKPRLPNYKPKKGRFKLEFTTNTFRLKQNIIHFHKCLQGFTIKTKQQNIVNIQIVPRLPNYVVNIVYEKEINTELKPKYIAGIDLGINNFSAITVWNKTSKPIIIDGKGLKSYNKYFNKTLSKLKSEAVLRHNKHTTKRIQSLYLKRNNYFKTWMHKASKLTIDYLIQNQVSHLVIGYNKGWKQESPLSKKVNQTFIQIPYQQYINYITYKAQEQGIKVYHVEESYTSGTSFLDNEPPDKEHYNKQRRIHRGLFQANIQNHRINADINASYQISKKVFKSLSIDLASFTPQQLHNKLVPRILKVA